ncbi:YdeI/OmpD-associated family protein [soil metagenome]
MDTGDETKNGQPIRTIPDSEGWQAWLDEHHADHPGVWLKLAKKSSPASTVSYAEALDVALCYGWIDAQAGSYDEHYWLQRFCPRGPRSSWSKINREKVAVLTGAGRMRPAGVAAVQAAQADGRWDAAYDPPSRTTVPPDFRERLDAHPDAAAFWAALNSANRYAMLYRIQTAKKPETRARRIEQFLDMLGRGEKLHP